MATENRVQLMWNCATTLEPNSHTHQLLKSYYMNMCRKFAKNTLQIPKEKFSTSQMCSHCGCFWSESEFSMKLKPQQVALKAKAKKLIEKLGKSKETGQRGLLSRTQRRRAKWLQKRVHNYIEMKCEQCKYKSLIKMEKPKAKHKKEETGEELMEVQVTKIEAIPTTKSKKKKKNKNKSAGLKLPFPLTSHKQEPPVTQMPNKPKTTETPDNYQKSDAVSKQNKSKKKQKQKSTLGITPSYDKKVVSKTQHQNSLLQLAALLKQQTTATTGDGKSSAQKRLESLLK